MFGAKVIAVFIIIGVAAINCTPITMPDSVSETDASGDADIVTDMHRNREKPTTKAAWCKENLLDAKTSIQKSTSKRQAAKNIPFIMLRNRPKNQNMTTQENKISISTG
ncbi:hypothetical protein FQR65_LT03332 [Abscondita terminalis]|nr:hypothetical protein FQR65_LT03332 [Abscondita terminalis]